MTLSPHIHDLLDHPTIAHGFFGRAGGVSKGIYAELNVGLGSGDDPAHVAKNRLRVAQHFGASPAQLCTLYQVHSPDVVTVTDAHIPRPEADAMVTARPGIVLGILTADCAPVLLADAEAGVIGAAHAGWKGAHGGVIENTVAAMEELGADRARIAAVVGPAIGQASYEVGPEFVARFTAGEQALYFLPSTRAGHFLFDLPAYAEARLLAAGLQRVAALAMDTCAREAEFFSYRRTTLRGEPDYGRQISAITLR